MTITNAKQRILAERLLLPIALALAILFDRLMVANIFQDLTFFSAIFWLCYLVIFYAFYWARLKSDGVAWFVAICVTALCIWNFIFTSGGQNWQFSAITFFVIPAVLMAHAQWAAGGFTLKNSEGMASAWIFGAFVKPFTGLVPMFETIGSLFAKRNRPLALRVLIGSGLALVVMAVIIPLLMGADQVFNHIVSQIFANFSIRSILFHLTVIIIAFGLFYSFLWNIGMGENKIRRMSEKFAIDPVISGIVLGSIITIYILFCIIQFTYLFAGAGLPAGLTYAEYARAGFAQTVAVCAINLLIFGIFLRFGPKEAGQKTLRALLTALLALTVVMLLSGAVRLNLYIEVFGMTWLRLLSAWFILYMAATVALSAVRLFWKTLPVLTLAALLLLIWYVALGYLNPDAFIAWFN